jgi:hypothetical protein
MLREVICKMETEVWRRISGCFKILNFTKLVKIWVSQNCWNLNFTKLFKFEFYKSVTIQILQNRYYSNFTKPLKFKFYKTVIIQTFFWQLLAFCCCLLSENHKKNYPDFKTHFVSKMSPTMRTSHPHMSPSDQHSYPFRKNQQN